VGPIPQLPDRRRVGTLVSCAGSLLFQKSEATMISTLEVCLLREVVEHPGEVPSAQQIFTSLDNLLDPVYTSNSESINNIDLRRHPRAPRPATTVEAAGGEG
jgi:hypothetical protein